MPYPIFILSLLSFFDLFNSQIEGVSVQHIHSNLNSLVPRNGDTYAFRSPIASERIRLYRKLSTTKNQSTVGPDEAEEHQGYIKTNKGINEKFHSKLTTMEDHAFGVTLLAIGTFSLLGNGRTLSLYFQQKHQPPIETLFIHQAIIDLLFTLSSFPFLIISSFKHGWIFGEFGCTVHGFISGFLSLTSVFSITPITIFQYTRICTLSEGCQITCGMYYGGISCCYLTALIWALVPVLGIGRYDPQPIGFICAVNWNAKDKASQVYLLLVAVFGVFIPLASMMTCYFYMVPKANISDVEEKRFFGQTLISCLGTLVVAGFVVARIPITLAVMFSSFRGVWIIPLSTTGIAVILDKSFPALNFFIYTFYKKKLSQVMAN